MSLCLGACAGSAEVSENVARPRTAASLAEAKPWPTEALKASGSMAKAEPKPSSKAEPKAQRDAKTARTTVRGKAVIEEEEETQDFSGVDVGAPVDSDNDDGPREVAVEGIEGTTSEFDVRTTLENRAEDFDRCHDQVGNGGGRIVYRIHIEANGDVGGVKVRPMRSRNRKLVECYTDVVASSHFPKPHGGYADVKWTTKVGRSKKRPSMMLDRPHRWDTPAGSSAAR